MGPPGLTLDWTLPQQNCWAHGPKLLGPWPQSAGPTVKRTFLEISNEDPCVLPVSTLICAFKRIVVKLFLKLVNFSIFGLVSIHYLNFIFLVIGTSWPSEAFQDNVLK